MFPQTPFEIKTINFSDVENDEIFELNVLGQRLIIPHNILPQDLFYNTLEVAFNQPRDWVNIYPLAVFDVDFEKLYLRHQYGFLSGSLAATGYHIPPLKLCIIKNRDYKIYNFQYSDKYHVYSDFGHDFNADAHVIPYGSSVATVSIVPHTTNDSTFDVWVRRYTAFSTYEEMLNVSNVNTAQIVTFDVTGFYSIHIDINSDDADDTYQWGITYE